MAPPRHRRAGFSRRARFGLFAGYVIASAGMVVALGLILAARFDPDGFNALRVTATDLSSPFTAAGRGAVRGFVGAGEAIGDYWDAATQNAALRAEVAASRAKLVEARALALDNRRLKRALRLVEQDPGTIVVTRIVGSTAASTRRLATLAAGTDAGVRVGQPVRSAEGLIGRVTETGHRSARVLLLTDGNNTVPVRLAQSGIPALATGRGDGWIELRALIAGATPFRRGDIAVTSGTGGVYPAGIPVAVVTAAKGDIATAWPLADPARLDYATVVGIFQADLPPPAPSASPAKP